MCRDIYEDTDDGAIGAGGEFCIMLSLSLMLSVLLCIQNYVSNTTYSFWKKTLFIIIASNTTCFYQGDYH